jgi:probable HAF family extracellular repeat protein
MKRSVRRLSAASGCVAILFSLASTQQAAAQPYTITQSYTITLIQYPQHRTHIFGLNNRGQAVGTNDPDGLVYDAGTLYTLSYPGAIQTELLAINDRGDIVGHAQVGNPWVNFLYAHGSFTTLNLPATFTPAAINNRGEIVGTYGDSSQVPHGFIYADGIIQTIDVPDSTGTWVVGINDRGEMVGMFRTDQGSSAFVYSGRTFTPISLPGTPEGINNQGQIVALNYVQDGTFVIGAFVYYQGSYNWFVVPDGVFCDRGFIQGETFPKAINDRGEVAGFWQGYSDNGGFIARPVHPVSPSELEVGTCHR